MVPKSKGLIVENILKGREVIIDPDNVFWGIVNEAGGTTPFIPESLVSLYRKTTKACDEEMEAFRFGAGLTAVYIDPTDRCNANCPYCYVPQAIRTNGRSMSQDELEFVLKKLEAYFKDKRKAVIVFHASEPLLVKDILFRAIDKFKGKFYFGIQTNALLLEKKDVDFVKSRNVSIGISLDASDAATNDRLRKTRGPSGNFRRAVQAIEWFDGYKGLNVITTITNLNVKALPGLVRFLHKKKVGCVLMNPVRLTQPNSRELRPDDAIMAKYFIRAVREAIDRSRRTGHRIIIGNFANVLLAIIAPTARRLMCDISPCGGARCFFTITAKGEMIPCGEFIGLNGFSGGNIFKDSIESAMTSRAFKKIRSRFVERIEECDVCSLRNICGAPCPAELHATGGMLRPAIFCEFYKKVIAYAFKLIAEGEEVFALRAEGMANLRYRYRL